MFCLSSLALLYGLEYSYMTLNTTPLFNYLPRLKKGIECFGLGSLSRVYMIVNMILNTFF